MTTTADRLNKAAETLGYGNVAEATAAGFTPDKLLAMLGTESDSKPTKPALDWKSDVAADLATMERDGKTREFFSEIVGFTPNSTPDEGMLVGWSKADTNEVRAIPYKVANNGNRYPGKHIRGTVETLRAILAVVSDGPSTKPSKPSKAPRSRPGSDATNAPTSALLEPLGAKALRTIADNAGVKFGKGVDRRKSADLADALAAHWNSDLADALEVYRSGANA